MLNTRNCTSNDVRTSHTQHVQMHCIHNEAEDGGPVTTELTAYWAIMMLSYYSLGTQRNWSESIFFGDGRGWEEAWFIISCCIITLETSMKYSALCWNVWSFLLLQQDYSHLLRHNNGRGRGSKSTHKLPRYLWGHKSIKVDVFLKDKMHVDVSLLDLYLIHCTCT